MERVTAPGIEVATRVATASACGESACVCADRLREAADLLAVQGANPYRVAAYRRAADTLCKLDQAEIVDLVEREGVDGLDRLPHIGRGIATAIVEMVRTGHWTQLERLRGTADPVQLFTVVPGLGHRLAERIHEELHVDTLEALERALGQAAARHRPPVPRPGRRRQPADDCADPLQSVARSLAAGAAQRAGR